MCALRILTGRPGAFLESHRQKPTTTKELSTYMILLKILFGHRQHHNHPLSIEGGQLDFDRQREPSGGIGSQCILPKARRVIPNEDLNFCLAKLLLAIGDGFQPVSFDIAHQWP